jgi:hypothetical protein
MTRPEYVEFLGGALGNATRVSRDGAVHFVCCDWRHVTEIMEAGRLAYCETLNIVVWVKSNAGQPQILPISPRIFGFGNCWNSDQISVG